MRRNTVLAVLVALFAILFFAVVPSVSASAATGSTPGTDTCNYPTCKMPPAPALPPASPLTSKDPSKDVAPPAGTVPLVNNACEPSDSCITIDSRSVIITIDEYQSLNNEIRETHFRGFLTAIGLIAALVIVLVLLFDRSMERRQNRELASKQVTPGYKLN